VNRLLLHLRSLRNFSLTETLSIAFAIPLRKLVGVASAANLAAKSTFDFLLQGGHTVTKEGRLNKIELNPGSDPVLNPSPDRVLNPGPDRVPNPGLYPRPISFYVRRKSTDIIIFKEILYKQEYRYLTELRQKLNLRVNYIIDAGANIGTATVYMKSVFPEACIVSIEPEADNFRMLEKNIRANGFEGVTPFKGGLWNKETWLEVKSGFRDKERELSFYVTEVDESEKTDNSILGITVDGIKAKWSFPRIDILKIDIEGAERYLFSNLADCRRILADVKILAIEVHEEVVDKWALVAYLEELGYKQITFGEILYAYKEG
jgi:FkbM family methyltransferase